MTCIGKTKHTSLRGLLTTKLGTIYAEKSSPQKKGHPITRATLGEQSFHTFSYRTWQIVTKSWLGKQGDPPSRVTAFCDGRVTRLGFSPYKGIWLYTM